MKPLTVKDTIELLSKLDPTMHLVFDETGEYVFRENVRVEPRFGETGRKQLVIDTCFIVDAPNPEDEMVHDEP